MQLGPLDGSSCGVLRTHKVLSSHGQDRSHLCLCASPPLSLNLHSKSIFSPQNPQTVDQPALVNVAV